MKEKKKEETEIYIYMYSINCFSIWMRTVYYA